MDNTLDMYRIAVADDDELVTAFSEELGHQDYLIIYRMLKLKGQAWVESCIAGFLDPEGSDEDQICTDVNGKLFVLRGNLGTYGYWKALPAELRKQLEKDNWTSDKYEGTLAGARSTGNA